MAQRLLAPLRCPHATGGLLRCVSRRRLFASTSAIPELGAEPLAEELAFAQRVAATPAAALSAEDATRAAASAAQILALPQPELTETVGSDPWAVPLGQLLRAVVSYPSWLVPTDGAAMQTMSLEREPQPLLVACADQAALDNSPSPLDPEQRSHVSFKGDQLVFQWNQSHNAAVTFKEGVPDGEGTDGEAGAGGLGGIVFNPSLTTDGGTTGSGVLNTVCLPHLISISMAQPAEAALSGLSTWLEEGVSCRLPHPPPGVELCLTAAGHFSERILCD